MSKKPRRNFDATFKTKVVLGTLKGQKTLSQICSEYELHPTQVSSWKQQVLQGMPSLFSERVPTLTADQEEALTAPLYQQIGQLKVEVDFLKKKFRQVG